MKKIYLVSVSGGKDSTALIIYMLSMRKKEELVFNYFDTGWEHPSVYEYLEYLENKLDIKINRIGGKTFEELCIEQEYIPNFAVRFCSRVLKHEKSEALVKEYKEKGYNIFVCTGVRRDESLARSEYQCKSIFNKTKILQPLAYWSTQEVFDYLKKNKIEVNSLYKKGWGRVGCYPCIFARQTEIGLLEDWAIERVEKLEETISKIKCEKVTFFKENVRSKVYRSVSHNPLGLDVGCINQYGICE